MTTTTARALPAPDTHTRRARLGTLGGAMWALSSGAWAISDLGPQEFGSLRFVAVAVSWWIFMVLPPVLLVLGHVALRAALGPSVGRVGTGGLLLSALGIAAMGLGIGIEIASMSVGGGEVPAGHAVLLVGFLVAVAGALVTSITVVRKRRDGLSRAGGWLLVLAVPLGMGIGFLGSVLGPGNDAWFWAALTLPTGIAWVLLGRSLATGYGAAASSPVVG